MAFVRADVADVETQQFSPIRSLGLVAGWATSFVAFVVGGHAGAFD